MRLAVRHLTSYRYSRPIAYAIQTLRLTPRPHEGLAVLRWQVRGETRRPLPFFIDGFGTIVHSHSINRPHDSGAILVEGEVETRPTDGVIRGAPEPLPLEFFLRTTKLTQADPAIAELAVAGTRGGTSRDRLTSLMEAIHGRLVYRQGVTDAKTTAAQALRNGSGVCQDHAHLFIAAARHLGTPARYVGGYLWTGAEGGEYEASHAWAEAYAEDTGWIGFDPSNGTVPGEAYIRTGVGLDYWSAAPVRGIWRGEAEETLAVEVTVTQAQAEQ
ncbi:MAG TPA: transglutaminase family protein [Stellaceae bacterium]|nr:transglutaminase family protein [Stellaceae bacterium]